MINIVTDRLKNKSSVYYNQLWREPSLFPFHQLRNFVKTFLESLNLFPSDMVPFADRCFSKIVNQNKYDIGVTQVKNMYFQLINSDMESKLEMNI